MRYDEQEKKCFILTCYTDRFLFLTRFLAINIQQKTFFQRALRAGAVVLSLNWFSSG